MFGVLAVTQAMLPRLRETPAARIVNMSSSVGSLTLNSDPACVSELGGIRAIQRRTISQLREHERTVSDFRYLEELWSKWALKGFVEAFPIIETSEESDRLACDDEC